MPKGGRSYSMGRPQKSVILQVTLVGHLNSVMLKNLLDFPYCQIVSFRFLLKSLPVLTNLISSLSELVPEVVDDRSSEVRDVSQMLEYLLLTGEEVGILPASFPAQVSFPVINSQLEFKSKKIFNFFQLQMMDSSYA